MFTIQPDTNSSRRAFLRIGAFGLGALGLPALLHSATRDLPWVRDRSVVWLWLGGGPPQAETWDPKPDAPESVRTMFGAVKTSLPGVAFGSHFPKLAARAHRLAIVRSFQTPCKDHQENWVRAMLTGVEKKPSPPSAGSVYAYLRGTNHPQTGMPSYVLLDSGNNREFLQEHFLRGNTPGDLPEAYAPFNPAGVITPIPKPTGPQRKPDGPVTFSPLLRNMELRLPADRAADRRELLRCFDTGTRALETDRAFAAHDAYIEQAYTVLKGSVAEAFRLDRESAKTVEKYDTSHITLTCPNFLKLPDFPRRPSMLGRQMLLARRLCEAGAGLVMVENCGWDFHGGDGLNPNQKAGLDGFGPSLDRAVSAFLDDVRDRGLEDRILLVVCGEMGRTPKINKSGGRDHWPALAPLFVAGGGFKMGQVIGRSDAQAGRPVTTPVTTMDLVSTVLQTLLDPTKLRLFPNIRQDLLRRVEEGRPIPGLV